MDQVDETNSKVQDTSISASDIPFNPKEFGRGDIKKLVQCDELELTKWLQNVLSDYCNYTFNNLMNQESKGCLLKQSPWKSYCLKAAESILKALKFLSGQIDQVKDIGFHLTNVQCEPVESSLESRDNNAAMLNVKIEYKVGDIEYIFVDHLTIQVGQFLLTEQLHRNERCPITDYMNLVRREIDCYLKLFPNLDSIARQHSKSISLPIPTCYYANYDIAKLPVPPAISVYCSHNVAQMDAALILQDLEKCGYVQMRRPCSLEDAKLILKSIAKLHACSWISFEQSPRRINAEFPFLVNTKDCAHYYARMCRSGLITLVTKFEENYSDEASIDGIISTIQTWMLNLNELFENLLDINTIRSPITILHTDLHCGHIFYRPMEYTDENGNTIQRNEVEVKIDGWKLVCYGSAMLDVAFFILSSMSNEDRKLHYQKLILFYYEHFMSFIKEFNLTINFSLEGLYRDYWRSLWFSVLMICGNVHKDSEPESLSIILHTIQEVLIAQNDESLLY